MEPRGTKVLVLSIVKALPSVKYLYGMTKAVLDGLYRYCKEKKCIPSWRNNGMCSDRLTTIGLIVIRLLTL